MAELRLDEALALEAPVSFQGRATYSGVPVYDVPAFKAKKLTLLGKDQVVDILTQIIGDGDYNRIWYHFDKGYTYSGWLQPVQTNLQKPLTKLPRARVIGEVTVPFAETRFTPDPDAARGYRAYYGTTHWVTGVYANKQDGSRWYQVYDSHLQMIFYVAAEQLRIVPDGELTLLSPDVPNALKSIHVDLRTQYVTAFEGEKLILRARCSSGAGPKTPLGDFQTYHKGPSVHMTNEGDDTAHIYDLPGVPWVSFFTPNGDAFHGTYWHNDFGKKRSHGCVNLTNSAAKFIYRWTSPTVPPETEYLHKPKTGTVVHIIKSTA
jgi:hypothetical protein